MPASLDINVEQARIVEVALQAQGRCHVIVNSIVKQYRVQRLDVVVTRVPAICREEFLVAPSKSILVPLPRAVALIQCCSQAGGPVTVLIVEGGREQAKDS